MNFSLFDGRGSTVAADAGHFAFSGPSGHIRATGAPVAIARGSIDSLETRLEGAFADCGPEAIIGGAMPFHRQDHDYLWLSPRCTGVFQTVERSPAEAVADHARADPPVEIYTDAVITALRQMERERDLPEGLKKIVLARSLKVRTQDPISLDGLMARLADDPTTTAFRVALPDSGNRPRALIGASPELLLEKRGNHICSYPLAGSARRLPDTVEDANACTRLASSEKDRREHAIVVEYILDTLAPFCDQLACPDGTRLTCTRSMWHLGTRITGQVKDRDMPAALLAAHLHPTPAVCGSPRDRADELIRHLEPVPRGFYAGAVGWSAKNGDGAWHVAIRCAEICGCDARLFAGAGIIPGSDPMAEAVETGSKFAALLRALGLPASAALAGLD